MIKYKIFFTICFLFGLSFSRKAKNNRDEDYESDGEEKDNQDKLDINFLLYTRDHPNNFNILRVKNNRTILNTDFDPRRETKFIVHGWENDYESIFSANVKNAYLRLYDVNVIVADWSQQSHENYFSSRMGVTKVSEVLAQLIDLLVKEFGMQSSMVHLIGHSLGAHVSGIAGLKLKTGNVSRITGLDPALPMFSTYERDRLRPDSADFVDVIHSCGNYLGFKSALGQVDFYPNGGTYKQPGCRSDYTGECSHARAYKFFLESITSYKFRAVKCVDWDSFVQGNCDSEEVPMGEHTSSKARGNYYLTTNSEAPFARGSVVYPDD